MFWVGTSRMGLRISHWWLRRELGSSTQSGEHLGRTKRDMNGLKVLPIRAASLSFSIRISGNGQRRLDGRAIGLSPGPTTRIRSQDFVGGPDR
jgi:hypothetical protein